MENTGNMPEDSRALAQRPFQPEIRHYLIAFFSAMLMPLLVSLICALCTGRGIPLGWKQVINDVILYAMMFPAGLIISASLILHPLRFLPDIIVAIAGWVMYSALIAYGITRKSRCVFFVFIVLLLINTGGCCVIAAFSFSSIHLI